MKNYGLVGVIYLNLFINPLIYYFSNIDEYN